MATATAPARRLIPGNPGLAFSPIQAGNEVLAICTIARSTMMPEIIGLVQIAREESGESSSREWAR